MSWIRKAVAEYLALRRGLGFKLYEAEAALAKFTSFLEHRRASYITTQLALDWATQAANAQPAQWAARLSVVRGFAKYRAATDPRTEVPPTGLLPARRRRKPPYIYTDDEIGRLIMAAGHLPSKTGLRPRTYATLFGLLSVTGMRIGEAVALDREDVDLVRAVHVLRRTKYGKSRLIPVHATTRRALERYTAWRDRLQPRPRTPSFFVGDQGQRVLDGAARWTFVQLSHQVGLRSLSDRRGPRLHDLRHRFAVRTLLRWYQAGVDVEQHLPRLSTYLGHGHVTDTYWYLSAVPELMQVVAARLELRARGSPA